MQTRALPKSLKISAWIMQKLWCVQCRPSCVRKTGAYSINMQVSFEFKNRKAMPIIRGIVIASEHEALILEVREIDISLVP